LQEQVQDEKVSNPFGIFGIIFIAFYSCNPFGIGNGNIDTIFQKVKDRNPVLTGRFHTDIMTIIVKQPLFKMADVAIERGKSFFW
jgi:hypothetical protein